MTDSDVCEKIGHINTDDLLFKFIKSHRELNLCWVTEGTFSECSMFFNLSWLSNASRKVKCLRRPCCPCPRDNVGAELSAFPGLSKIQPKKNQPVLHPNS